MWEFVYKHSETIEHVKKNIAYFLKKITNLTGKELENSRIKKAKFSGYCFYINTNI